MYVSRKLFSYLYIVLFSIAFIFFPWEENLNVFFWDQKQYLINISLSDQNLGVFSFYDGSFFSITKFIFSEPLWQELSLGIHHFFKEPLLGLQIVSLVSLFLILRFIYLNSNISISLLSLFIFNPMVVDFLLSQIRSSFALSLILTGLSSNKKNMKVILLIASILIHSASLIFYSIYWIIKRISDTRFIKLTPIVVALFFGIIMVFVRSYILFKMGDRRAIYNANNGTLTYLFFWVFLSMYFLFTQENKIIKDKLNLVYEQMYVCFIYITFITALFGLNTIRFIPMMFPFLLIALSNRQIVERKILFMLLFLYQIVQYFFWLKVI